MWLLTTVPEAEHVLAVWCGRRPKQQVKMTRTTGSSNCLVSITQKYAGSVALSSLYYIDSTACCV
eukprot:SAG25_NODE_686_length_5927_cov_26.546921_2_plen_65_part_00